MSDRTSTESISLQQALRAQRALRDAAGLGEEQFPVEAFVGMISDEVDALRQKGHTDEQIAALIRKNGDIPITADELAAHYAPASQRHQPE